MGPVAGKRIHKILHAAALPEGWSYLWSEPLPKGRLTHHLQRSSNAAGCSECGGVGGWAQPERTSQTMPETMAVRRLTVTRATQALGWSTL